MTRPSRPKLICPFCNSRFSKVIDTGLHPRYRAVTLQWTGRAIWRRRECIDCHKRYDTREEILIIPPISCKRLSDSGAS